MTQKSAIDKFTGRVDAILHANSQDIADYWYSEGSKATLIFLWGVTNAFLFFWTFDTWKNKKPYFAVFGNGVTFARGAASCLAFNSALILVPMSRTFLRFLQGTPCRHSLPLHKNVIFHRYMGWAIVFFTIIHGFAHYFNDLSLNTRDLAILRGIFPTLEANPPRGFLLYFTPAGLTGHAICYVMVIMYTSAVKNVRRKYFELFWFSHHLFIFFYGFLLVHGAFQLLHTPPKFWIYFIGPGLLYTTERLLRVYRGNQDTQIHKVIIHPSDVIELQLIAPQFKYKTGQYLFINCPYLSTLEWHPITISSSPYDPYLGVHIRVCGDWTRALLDLLSPETRHKFDLKKIAAKNLNTAVIRIDGPVGAPAGDVFDYEVVVLIGAGIGVTPFSSVLKTIRNRILNPEIAKDRIVLKKLYFYWIIRKIDALEWFYELVVELESQIPEDYFEAHVYLTRADEYDQAAAALSRLRNTPHTGRPNFDEIFQNFVEWHPVSEVGVFFCGPSVLSKSLNHNCRRYSSRNPDGIHFSYHKENF